MSRSLPPPRRPAHHRNTLATPPQTPPLPLQLNPITDVAPGPPSATGSSASGFASVASLSVSTSSGAAAVVDMSAAEMDSHLAMLDGLGPPGATRRPTRRVKSIERTWAWVRSRSSVYGEQALMGLDEAHDQERRAYEVGPSRPLTVAASVPIPHNLEVATPVRRQSAADLDPEERRRRRQGLTPESLRPPPRPRTVSRSNTTPLPLKTIAASPPQAGPSSTSSSPTPNPNGTPRQRPRPIIGKQPPQTAAAVTAAVSSTPASPSSSTSSARTPVQSIHDIVRRHSSALTMAQEHVKVRARAELASRAESPLAQSRLKRREDMAVKGLEEEVAEEDEGDLDEDYDYVDQEAPPPPLPPKQQRYLHSREPSRASLGSFNSSDTDSVVRDFRLAQAAYDQLTANKPMPTPPPVVHPPTPTRNNIFAPTPDPSPRAGHGRERNIHSPDPDPLARQRSTTSLLRPNSASPRPSLPDDDAREIAMYLRSPQLNRIMHLPRPFPERPLQVSFADLGKADGRPVVVFLGLGSVRYLVALYDDLARALGLRLICIDRWGLGKTDQVPQDRRGLLDWADVVRQVLDELGINRFQIVAHSAGAPYALATALKMERRIHGKIHLLSPWVGGDVEGELRGM